LKYLGYPGARFLEGGIRAWQSAGLALEDGLAGAKVTIEEAQGDFGHTLFKGALAKSRPQMEHYLSWEEALISR
jgi:3-mercaptopyruvate sulfurtransferase SseA